MGIFKSKSVRELERIIEDIDINLSNNYKEPAHKARMRLKTRADELFSVGSLKEKDYKRFITIYEEYSEMMKDYRH